MSKSENKQLQRALRETVAPKITVDGVLGNETNKAIFKFSMIHGVSEQKAKEMLNQYAELRYVNDEAFRQAAVMLNVPESYVRAIAEVESAGESFLEDGRVKILFERHWFRKKLKERLAASVEVRNNVASVLAMPSPTGPSAVDLLLSKVEATYPNICNAERGGYKGKGEEWVRHNIAMVLDLEAACQAASYGGYQLMGFNHKLCGYDSAKDMMLALAASESKQFLAMISFIKAQPGMHAALKRGDWAKFAELYNGSAYKENKYDTKLEAAERKWLKASYDA